MRWHPEKKTTLTLGVVKILKPDVVAHRAPLFYTRMQFQPNLGNVAVEALRRALQALAVG